jgi:hypothetical protein
MSAKEKNTDWDAIERSYRAGVLTNREIAKQHEITEGAIRKRAKAKGWEKDLTGRVQEAVRTQLVRTPVRTETPADQVSEKQIVQEAAATIVEIVRSHRRDITEHRDLAATLKQQLVDAVGNREALEALIHEETEPDEDASGSAKAAAYARRAAMLKAVALPQHIASAKDLSMVLKNLVSLEREAFNVGGDRDEAPVSTSGFVPPGLDELTRKLRGQA